MTWFETKQSSANNSWGIHWTMANRNPDIINNDGHKEIASHYYPLIGPYHSGDPDVIEYHLLLMKYAGIDGILIDWYGTHDVNDYAIIKENSQAVIDIIDKVGLKYAIVYEDRVLPEVVNKGFASSNINAAKKDMQYLQKEYFKHDSYIKINNQPLLMVFGPITLQTPNEWSDVFSAFSSKPTFLTLWNESADAGNNAQGEYAWVYKDNSYLRDFYTLRKSNLSVAMGGVYPGFKDYYTEGGWGSDINWEIDHQGGLTLDETLDLAENANLDYIQLITWNDFGEGTILEPTAEFKFTYLDKIKSFAGVEQQNSVFDPIHQLYQLRKQYANNAAKQKQLDQAFNYFVSLQYDMAFEILEGINNIK